MDEDDSLDSFSQSSSNDSSFGWVPFEDQENTNTSNKTEMKDVVNSSDTSSENGSISEKSDMKSLKEGIIIKKEKNPHQLSEEESISPSILDSNKRKLKKHVKLEGGRANDTLNKIHINGTLDTSECIPFNLDSDDEVWIIQCPANMEAGVLKGSHIDIGGISTFGANYVGTTLSQKTDAGSNLNLLMPNKHFELKTVPVAGHIIITQKVDVPPLELPAVKNKIATPLPEGLKLRHPLLGFVNSNSKSFDCEAAYDQHKTKKKKKKRKHNDSSQNTTYSDSEISPSPSKKKKKKKPSQSESFEMAQNIIKKEKYDEIEDVIESSQATKKQKSSLHEDCGSEVLFPLTQYFDDSMETNNSSFERKKKKKRKNDKYDITESQVQDEGLVTPTHFKKKKRKSDTDDSISFLNTSVSKKSDKKYADEQNVIPQFHNSSSERLMLKRRHSEHESNSASPKKKKKKLSHSQE